MGLKTTQPCGHSWAVHVNGGCAVCTATSLERQACYDAIKSEIASSEDAGATRDYRRGLRMARALIGERGGIHQPPEQK